MVFVKPKLMKIINNGKIDELIGKSERSGNAKIQDFDQGEVMQIKSLLDLRQPHQYLRLYMVTTS